MLGTLPSATAAEPVHTASLTPGVNLDREATSPAPLSGADAVTYRRIFKLQDNAAWQAADAEIAKLRDRVLVGHVEAQRYLHRNYRTRYDEARIWLERYADLPEARSIHALAVNRKPPGAAAPARPVGTLVPLSGVDKSGSDLRPLVRGGGRDLTASDQTRAVALKARLRNLVRVEPTEADRIVRTAETRRLLDDHDIDEILADLAEGYLLAGQDQRAVAAASATLTPAWRPLGLWNGGLASWRLGRIDDARTRFETLAAMPGLSGWTRSAAAYWAARANLRAKRPQFVNRWLGIAAEYPRTFYGLIARRTLGLETYFNFEAEAFTEYHLDVLSNLPAGRRALALVQIGDAGRAEMEMRQLATEATIDQLQALVALADRGNMPALSLQLAGMLGDRDGRRHDHAFYPVPRWEPIGGFKVDRALMFALMRQESEFLPEASSPAGAVGLMQLMPTTARAVADKAGLKGRDRERFNDPTVNMTLGQQYVADLSRSDVVGGNLMMMAAAYNAGPSNAARWTSRPEFKTDPLLVLETLPSRETRLFVEHVMTNYWIYRIRFGQALDDLDALASGTWPAYVALDPSIDKVTRNAAAR